MKYLKHLMILGAFVALLSISAPLSAKTHWDISLNVGGFYSPAYCPPRACVPVYYPPAVYAPVQPVYVYPQPVVAPGYYYHPHHYFYR